MKDQQANDIYMCTHIWFIQNLTKFMQMRMQHMFHLPAFPLFGISFSLFCLQTKPTK